MAQEHDHLPSLSQSVRDFIAAEASRRGIRRWETCASQLVQEIGMAIGMAIEQEEQEETDDEFVDLLRSRIDSIGKGKWNKMDDLKKMEQDTLRRLGLTPQ